MNHRFYVRVKRLEKSIALQVTFTLMRSVFDVTISFTSSLFSRFPKYVVRTNFFTQKRREMSSRAFI